jgi:hypothetical protein
MTTFKKALLALAGGTVLASAPADALTINLIDIGGVAGSKAEQGFRIAANYWESVLTSDAIVNFQVGFDKLDPGVLGGTRSALFTYVPIADYKDALAATGNSTLDATVAANFPALSRSGSVDVIVPEYNDPANQLGIAAEGLRTAPDGTPLTQTIAISTANYKALVGSGIPALDAIIDGEIIFSSDYIFDFRPNDGVNPYGSDFIGVAIHEIGHALGFLSGAQDFDYSSVTSPYGADQSYNPDNYWWGYAADMFRYTAPGELNWAFDQPAYFSIDGGTSAFNGANWSSGEINGDGWQASHWQAPRNNAGNFTCSGVKEGIMNPYLCSGQKAIVTGSDLAMLDAIGWNTAVDVTTNPGYTFDTGQIFNQFNPAAVPEPASWGMMLIGFGGMGGALRLRRRQAKAAA